MANSPIPASSDYAAIVAKLLKQLRDVVQQFANPDNARDTIRLMEIDSFAKRLLSEQDPEAA